MVVTRSVKSRMCSRTRTTTKKPLFGRDGSCLWRNATCRLTKGRMNAGFRKSRISSSSIGPTNKCISSHSACIYGGNERSGIRESDVTHYVMVDLRTCYYILIFPVYRPEDMMDDRRAIKISFQNRKHHHGPAHRRNSEIFVRLSSSLHATLAF